MAESDSGNLPHTCPTCGRDDFDSRRALAIHHSATHDRSLPDRIATCEVCGDEYEVVPSRDSRYCSYECMGEARAKDGTEATCEWCGETFRVPPSQTADARYCSEECKHDQQGEQWEGEGNPRWKGSNVSATCQWCGGEYAVKPSEADSSTYCSIECKGEAYQAERVGEDNPRWQGGDSRVECDWCGDTYRVKPAKAENSRYCTDACKNEAQTELTGQDNPNWEGGYTLYRALRQQLSDASWDKIRDEQTADQCRVCGAVDNLHLHHIIPLKRGGTNGPWNLLTLCRTHHKYAEEYTKNLSPRTALTDGWG